MQNKSLYLILFLLIFTQMSFAVEDCVVNKQSESIHLIMTEHTILYAKQEVCKPPPLTGVSVTKLYNQYIYSLNWDKQDHDLWHIDHYEILDIDGDSPAKYSFDADLPIFIDLGGMPQGNELFQYTVRSCSSVASINPTNTAVACSEWTHVATQCDGGCTDGSQPTPTLNTLPTSSDNGNYTVSWNNLGYEKYELQQSTNNGTTWTSFVDIPTTSKAFTNQTDNTTFTYRVRGCNGNICSRYSAVKSILVHILPSTPILSVTTPTKISISTPTKENNNWAYTASWNMPNTNKATIVKYKLKESIDSGATWKKYILENDSSMFFNNQQAGMTYQYKVNACNINNLCSTPSEVQEVTVPLNSIPAIVQASNVSIFKDPYTNKFRLYWKNTPANVSNYQVKAINTNGEELVKQLNKSSILPLSVNYELDAFSPNNFKIRACSESTTQSNTVCGGWRNIVYNLAPARVTYLESKWTNLHPTNATEVDNNTHYLHYNYIQNYMDNNLLLNGFFEIIESRFPTYIINTINFSSSSTTEGWNTPSFSKLLYQNGSLTVKACVTDTVSNQKICGPYSTVAISKAPQATTLTTNHFAAPNITNMVCDSVNNTINFKVSSTQHSRYTMDYYEIVENQPVANAIGMGTPDTLSRADITYIKEIKDPATASPHAEIKLKRLVNGQYNFTVRTCHKVDGFNDVCSIETSTELAACELNKAKTMSTTTNPDQSPISDITWYEDGIDASTGRTKKVINWQILSNEKPDYFYIRKTNADTQVNESNSIVNTCVNIRDTDPSKNVETLTKYSKHEFAHYYANEEHKLLNIDQGNNPNYWSTRAICSEGIQVSNLTEINNWDIYACQNGRGCTNAATIDINDTSLQTAQVVQKNAINNQTKSTIGPGSLNPGLWWNPYQAGTGWYFYWVNKIDGLSNSPNVSNPFDLKAYWITYKEINGVWSPIWLESNLMRVSDPTIEEEMLYKGSIIYSYIDENHNLIKKESGSIELDFANVTDNKHATLILNVSYDGNLFTQNQINYDSVGSNVPDDYIITNDGKIEFPLEDFAIKGVNGNSVNGNSIFGTTGNDLDHYTGAWSNAKLRPYRPTTILTWIERELEVMNILLFDSSADGRGEPLWVQAQSEGVTNPITADWFPGNALNLEKVFLTSTKGFNPLGYKPVDYNVSNNLEAVASARRKLNFEDSTVSGSKYTQLKLDFEIAIPFDVGNQTIDLNGRSINYTLGNGIYVGGELFQKIANVHTIQYFLTNNDGSEILYEPGLIGTKYLSTCNPNDTETNGKCIVHFNWNTTDDFPDVKAYYRLYNDNTLGEPQLLSDLCDYTADTVVNPYNEYNYQCGITQPGEYRFELRKPSYQDNTVTIAIAESEKLTILPCQSTLCSDDEPLASAATPESTLDYTGTISANPNNDKISTTSGSFDIDESGSANYSIPIFAPPGRGGLAPQLALSYSSNSGNGVAGIGWNISGISSITRCLKSPEHDPDLTFYPAISMTTADALCIDGQRMFETGLDDDGNMNYKTEIDNFSKIIAIDQLGNGPKQFKIYTKNGEVRVYGSAGSAYKANKIFSADNNTGAQIISNDGSGTVHTWLLSQIKDKSTLTNRIRFAWDTKDGESYLSRVKWSNFGDGNTPHYQIDFEYSNSRPDASHHYGIGTEFKAYRHLKDVYTSIYNTDTAQLQKVRRIKLTYENQDAQRNAQASPPSGMIRLAQIEQCIETDSSCLEPVVFEWDDGNTQVGISLYGRSSSKIGAFIEMGYGSYKPIDINGDGQMELIFIRGYDDGYFIFEDLEVRYWVAYHTDSGQAPVGVRECSSVGGYYNYICDTGIEPFNAENNTADNFTGEKWFVLDYNGDGNQDILTPKDGSSNWQVILSDGNQIFNHIIDTGIPFYNRQAGSVLLDYTADGLPDLLTIALDTSTGSNLYKYKLYPMVKSGTSYHFSSAAADAKFVDIDTQSLHPIDMICSESTLGFNVPCMFDFINNTFFGRILANKLEPVTTDFNGDGYNDAIYSYTYRYSDGTCGLGTWPPTDPLKSNANSIPFGEYSTDAMEISTNLTKGVPQPVQHCQQKFKVIMLTSKNNDGSLKFSYGGRLGIVKNDFNNYNPPVSKCNEGISNSCTGTIDNNIGSFQVTDINGDGLADFKYLTTTGDFRYKINLGQSTSVSVPDVTLGDTELQAAYQYNKPLFSDSYNMGLPYINKSCKTQSTDQNQYTNDSCARRLLTQFLDYDGDGDMDVLYPELVQNSSGNNVKYLLKKFNSSNNTFESYDIPVANQLISYNKTKKAKDYSNSIFDLNGDGNNDFFSLYRKDNSDKFKLVKLGTNGNKPRNKITKITNLLNTKETSIAINYKSATDTAVYTKNTGSLVNDYGNSSPVFDILAPMYLVKSVTKSISDYADTTVEYKYEGLKVQGGGRGSLGFRSISSYDPEHNITTVTQYHQDFPYVGMPESTRTYYGDTQANNKLISESKSYYAAQETTLASGNKTYFPFLQKSIEQEHAFNTAIDGVSSIGAIQKTIINEFTYHNTHGNLATSKIRSSSFEYDPITGQLIEEIVNGGPDIKLRTEHVYNDYGMEIETYQCSHHFATRADCIDISNAKARPKGENYIQRYSKNVYDTQWFEYIDKTLKPYTSSSLSAFNLNAVGDIASIDDTLDEGVGKITEVATSEVISRDIYGSPTLVINYNGNAVQTVYGAYGEAQATATSLGTKSTIQKQWCDNANVNTSPYCPENGSIVITTTPIVGAVSKKFIDVQGKEIRSQSQDFDGNWTTVDTFYDNLGRTVKQSEPYTRHKIDNNDQVSNNAPASPIYYTFTDYDDMDRVTLILSPNHCEEDISNEDTPCTNTPVETATIYNNLTTTVINPLGQNSIKTYDISGKIVSATDNNNQSVYYAYDSHDNLTQTSGLLSTIIMGYDNLGRKTYMNDPDKGYWKYSYNPLGEQKSQSRGVNNSTQMQATKSKYDIQGRMYFRQNSDDETSIWEYDQETNTANTQNIGKLINQYSIGQYKNSAGNIAQIKHFTYDDYGRSLNSTTTIYDGEQIGLSKTYQTSTTYDANGRVFQNFDATSNGVLFQYNDYGYQHIIRDAANGLNGQIYHEILATDSRGNVTTEKFNNAFYSYKTYEPTTGFLERIETVSGLQTIQDLSYAFDSIGNLIRRTDNLVSNIQGRNNITETFKYDQLNRLKNAYLDYNTLPEQTYGYDDSGNLTTKSGTVQSYQPNVTNKAGPHAITSAGDKTYFYDEVGNVIKRKNLGVLEATFAYTSFDKPHTITANGWRAEISYGASRSRYIRKDIEVSQNKRTITHYLGGVEYIYQAQSTKAKRYIGSLVIEINQDSKARSQWQYNYLLKDHIGSTHTIVNQFGSIKTRMSFNAWGQRRKAPVHLQSTQNFQVIQLNALWNYMGQTIEETTNRGFTGHEHFDQVGIIHMNGRIYDPEIGRFLQADPMIQDPYDTQSLNRYSYVSNNPLSYTDPTGYARLRKGAIFNTVFTIVASVYLPGSTAIFGRLASTIYSSAITGAAIGAVTTGTLKGTVKGGVFAAITFGIGHGIDGSGGIENVYARGFAHGVAAGVSAEVDGGKFGHGFVSSILSSAADGSGLVDYDSRVGRVVANAIVAGTISEVTGGKFANGAMSAAFRVAFNHYGPSEKILNGEKPFFEINSKNPLPGIHEGMLSVPEDYFKVLYHVEALGGAYGLDAKQHAENADLVISLAVKAYVNDVSVTVNDKIVSFRSIVHAQISKQVSEHPDFIAGRMLYSSAQTLLLSRFKVSNIQKASVAAAFFTNAGYGRALDLYDKGANAARIISAGIIGK